MLPYFLIFMFASYLFVFEQKNNQFLLWLFFALFVFLAGFRDMIGGFDVYIYGELYESNAIQILNYGSFEKGFKLYLLALKNFRNNRHFMFFVTAFLIAFLHFRIIKKSTPILFFSLFIYFCKFFLFSFVYLRQGLAIALIWTAILYLDKKYIRFIFLVCVAVCFHKSAILFAPFYFISRVKIPTGVMISAAIITFFIAITSLANFLFDILADSVNDEKFARYSSKSADVNFFYLFEIILLVILVLFFKAKLYQSKNGIVVLNGLYCYIIISILSLTNATYVRFTWYFLIFIIIGIPMIYQEIASAVNKRHFKFAVYTYYSLMFFRLLTFYDDGDFLPYKSIFQDFERNGRWEFMEYR
jgi:hypothetical protein